MEQLDYNLLFRWFVGLGVDDPVWDHSTYSKNRDRLLNADVAKKFLAAILAHAKVAPLLSDEHFNGRRHADPGVGVDEELCAEA
jgi:transposase